MSQRLIGAIRKVIAAKVVDEIGSFWVVTKPSDKSMVADILFESTLIQMANQYRGGLRESDVIGFYKDAAKAKRKARALLDAKKDSK